jgi:beta-ureidopropionase / N-carbamoyl-L-amino-acid hydrolase
MNRRDFSRVAGGAVGAAAFPRTRIPAGTPPGVNGARLNRSLEELGAIGKTAAGAQRVAYSDPDRRARAFAMDLMRAAKLDVTVDPAGNIIGRRAGTDSSLPPVLFGSHIDSVPDGGDYDGVVGSLSAIEVARTLSEQNVRTRHPLEVVIFQNEESGLMGSKAMAGILTERDLGLVNQSGKSVREGIDLLGGDAARLSEARRAPGSIAAYLELHIEQGAVLDEAGINIGVVEGIVGIGWWDVTIEGFANHAGTTPMNRRKDAMLSAAKFIQAVNRIVRGEPGRQVGTVGRIEALPGAPNVIPGLVRTSLEIRDLDAAKIEALYGMVEQAAHQIGREDGTTFTFRQANDNQPAPTDPRIRDLIRRAARELGLTTQDMPSGAGHDAQDMAHLGPVGMIFVPSVGGISHSPREFTRPEDVENGANVLLAAVTGLAT